MSQSLVAGACDPRFARVRERFEAAFAADEELGAAVAVMVGGRLVVDLWGGFADRRRTRAFGPETLVNGFSTTKAFVAASALKLEAEGKLDLDALVSKAWPEFGTHGKEAATLGMMLDHTVGLPAVREILEPDALFSWETMTGALAGQEPWWTPGTRVGYHPFTFGWLVGEVIRRVSGVTPGRYFAENFAVPRGLDAHIGMDASLDARCADLRWVPRHPGPEPTFTEKLMAAPESMQARAFTNPAGLAISLTHVSRAWRGAEIPAANGHMTAKALAGFYAALPEILPADALAKCHVERSGTEKDATLDVPTRFSAGFMLSVPNARIGRSARSFGHPGAGGSLGFADLDAGVAFGYTPNLLGPNIQIDPRAAALMDAVYDSL